MIFVFVEQRVGTNPMHFILRKKKKKMVAFWYSDKGTNSVSQQGPFKLLSLVKFMIPIGSVKKLY